MESNKYYKAGLRIGRRHAHEGKPIQRVFAPGNMNLSFKEGYYAGYVAAKLSNDPIIMYRLVEKGGFYIGTFCGDCLTAPDFATYIKVLSSGADLELCLSIPTVARVTCYRCGIKS